MTTSTISPRAKIAAGAKIGKFVTINDDVEIGEGAVIGDFCTLGEPLSRPMQGQSSLTPPLRIGRNAHIRSHTIIYSGSIIGDGFQTGHRVTIREGMRIGSHCSVGTLSDLQGYATFGDYCRLHSNVHVGQKTVLGNYVFVYPYVVFTNDPLPPSETIVGCSVGNYAQVCTMSVVLPGVNIGAHALVGAGSIVNRDVPEYSLAVGNPAKVRIDVREVRSKSGDSSVMYPWPYRFSRGMPWAETGYEAWKHENEPE